MPRGLSARAKGFALGLGLGVGLGAPFGFVQGWLSERVKALQAAQPAQPQEEPAGAAASAIAVLQSSLPSNEEPAVAVHKREAIRFDTTTTHGTQLG